MHRTFVRSLPLGISLGLCLSLAACSTGAAGTDGDAGAEGGQPQEDGAVTQGDAARDTAPPADAPPPADSSAPVTDGPPPQGDAALPTGCIQKSGLAAYYGDLHAHTGYSDGTGTPAEAYTYARDTAKLDILALTDHAEQIPLNGSWSQYKAEADSFYAPGTFVTTAGFEYGSGFQLLPPSSTGHNNVFFADDMFPTVQLDFHDFYDTLKGCATCIGQFNHPGDGQDVNWDGFEYYADVDERMNLFELNSDPAWDLLFDALDQGWKLSPMWNQDNHSANWGTANDNRSGFWLTALDRPSLYNAMLERRTFATQDKNAWIKLMAAGSCWMGSILHGVSALPITVEVNDTDASAGFTKIDLFGPGGVLLQSHDCAGAATCSATFNVTVPSLPITPYALARATLTNGRILVSAPVWASQQ